MAKRLTKLRVDEVSAVDKAANGKRFLILKRHAPEVERVEKVIKHEDGKWRIYSHEGKQLGEYDTEEAAVKRLRQIEWFKNRKVKKAEAAKEVAKGDQTHGGIDVKIEEVQKAIEAAIEAGIGPVVKRLEDLEAQVSEVIETGATEPVEKSEDEGASTLTVEAITKGVQEVISEALAPIEERLSKVEQAAGQRQSGEPETVEKAEGGSFWTGLL